MQSRLNKYYDDHGFTEDTVELPSRLVKNQDLYKEVSSKELNSFDVNSNASVLDNKVSTVDIEKIKEMLDRKYREVPKDKSIGNKEEVIESVSLDETREYPPFIYYLILVHINNKYRWSTLSIEQKTKCFNDTIEELKKLNN